METWSEGCVAAGCDECWVLAALLPVVNGELGNKENSKSEMGKGSEENYHDNGKGKLKK